ncbi:MAG: hypothetical protein HY594_04905 [Candidatus Omnitrophica bacterium]|nr:hypothetical protein [Candidatus Omnitrophota bacterium]
MKRGLWLPGTALLILFVMLGAAAQWFSYPRFLDSYYHLAVMQGFRQAGGVALHAFWEAAPQGRPHLYPPLFHLLWMPAYFLVGNPITVARLWSVAAIVLLLVAMAGVGWKISGGRGAFFFVAAALASPNLYLSTLIHPTATFALAGVLAVWICVENRNFGAAGFCLGLTAYLHPALAWIALLALLFWGALDEEKRGVLGGAAALGALLALPWWLHLFYHLESFQWTRQPEANSLDIPILLVALGFIGAIWAFRSRSHPAYRFPLALMIATLPWLFLYPYRVASAQGLLPLAIFAALTLEKCYGRLRWLTLAIIAGMMVVAPVLTVKTEPALKLSLVQSQSGLSLAWQGLALDRGHFESLYDEAGFSPLAKALKTGAQPDDLLYCNYPYMGGLFSVLTGLSTTNSMVLEAGRPSASASIAHARRILWFKIPSPLDPENNRMVQELARQYNWKLLLETPLAYAYEAPNVPSQRQIRGTVIPWAVAYGLLFMALVGLLVLLRRPAKDRIGRRALSERKRCDPGI